MWGKAHELYGEDPPQIVKDRIQLELPGIIERKYDVIYMSAQKLVQDSLAHGYLVGLPGVGGVLHRGLFSGITEVTPCPPTTAAPSASTPTLPAGEGYGCGGGHARRRVPRLRHQVCEGRLQHPL